MANLEGGARYLRQQLDRFGGDVERALAAYNAGPGRVMRAGGVPNIPETRAYVAAVLGRLNAQSGPR
jgi:soluble lytic murein transglycosylase-like protein